MLGWSHKFINKKMTPSWAKSNENWTFSVILKCWILWAYEAEKKILMLFSTFSCVRNDWFIHRSQLFATGPLWILRTKSTNMIYDNFGAPTWKFCIQNSNLKFPSSGSTLWFHKCVSGKDSRPVSFRHMVYNFAV